MIDRIIVTMVQELQDIVNSPIEPSILEVKLRSIEGLFAEYLSATLSSTLEDFSRRLRETHHQRNLYSFSDGKEIGLSLGSISGREFRIFFDLIVTTKIGERILYEEGLLSGEEWDKKYGGLKG